MRKLALDDDILLNIEKPARYIGHEVNSVMKDKNAVDIRFAMCFPEVYEVGMSHLGIQILYDMFNRREDTWCERVYSPWIDLDKIMREKHIPLFALESQDPVKDFDFLGITLQFEMCYTNVLQVLDLSGIPLHSEDRTLEDPFVIGGGPCVYNTEPLAEFFDMFYIGEGEVVYDELLEAYKKWKRAGKSRKEFLEMAAEIEGIYVPSFYDVTYKEDGTIESFLPNNPHAKEKIKRVVAADMSQTTYPLKPVVPFIKVTQDRAVLEIQRGCIRGCRFCQAGMVYRPTRPRDINMLKETARAMLKNTGHEEITLSSLSSSDYTHLEGLVNFLIDEFKGNSGGQKYNSIVVDAENHKVIDILPSRFENDLIRYFSQFQSKTDVKYFVCDMNPHFREVAKACFPKAVIVADRFHVIRQVYWAMERVRKNEQNKLSSRFRKYFKRSRRLLMRPMEKLSGEEADKLALMFEIAPRLADAYRLKNEFLEVIHSDSSKTGKPKLVDWLTAVEVMDSPEFDDCTKAYRNWFQEILNSMDVPWSNGFIEGCNNKTKVLKRVCFGMRNFSNFRKRILFCHT